MLLKSFTLVAYAATTVRACASHENFQPHSALGKRQVRSIPQDRNHDWAYEASYNWGMINESYALCQTGTQQSPIPLQITQGLSLSHQPHFPGYPNDSSVIGNFYNWGYGPAFTVAREPGVFTTLPSMQFDNETVYMRGWHIHAPADHSVQGDRSKAELHFVHANADGKDRAVLAFRLDPGNQPAPFLSQLPRPLIGFNELDLEETISIDISLALRAVNNFNEFWTYQGSLTSPPCTEGLRWFVARTILFTSVEQLQALLGISTYSARAEQEVWRHQINV